MSLIPDLQRAIDPARVLVHLADQEPYLTDWRGIFVGRAAAVVLPKTTDEVSAIVRVCAEYGAPVVPQGGNTGQAGGATPDASGRSVVVSLIRMNRVRDIDLTNDTITIDAGCTQQAVQEAALASGRLFPLSFGAKGSCTVGGNLATNAGGMKVLRYGSARDLTLGIEVVTAEGETLHGLRGLRKDNSGYDLRDLFVGSEGTLGIITAATLKLYPLPRSVCTALVAFRSVRNATSLLQRLRAALGAELTSFELISKECADLVGHHFPAMQLPLTGPAASNAWFGLIEQSSGAEEAAARDQLERALGEALEAEEVDDVVIAGSLGQSEALWHIRESITLALGADGKCVKHDVSVPVSAIATFVENTDALLISRFPGVRLFVFGHLGDGNLHYNVARSVDQTEAEFRDQAETLTRLVHDSVHLHGGSITAEQGVGQLRLAEMERYKDPVELDFMRRIKRALDPAGIMNPGKVLGAPHKWTGTHSTTHSPLVS